MNWTGEAPTKGGWYFYREPENNMDKPMVAWVYTVNHLSMYRCFRRMNMRRIAGPCGSRNITAESDGGRERCLNNANKWEG